MASLKKKNNQIDIALDKTSFSIPYKPNEGREKKKLKPIISKIRELNNLSKSGERSKSLFPRPAGLELGWPVTIRLKVAFEQVR